MLKLDFALLLGAVGLIAFSIYTLGEATAEDVPGDPYFYVVRQSIYATVGIALMLAVARVDYSRFRELRVGIYYGTGPLDLPRLRIRRGDPRLPPLDRASVLHLPAF